MTRDLLGLMFVAGLFVTAAVVILASRMSKSYKQILIGALIFRVISAAAYFIYVWRPARDTIGADAGIYFRRGGYYAFWFFSKFDFSPIFESRLWFHSRWWGTQFVYYPAGLVIAAVGANPFASFLVFSLLGFIGLLCFVVVFQRAYPHVDGRKYMVFLLFLPSAGFWTSAIGKEAIVMFGLGLAALGLLARPRGTNWVLAACGLFLVFAVRPQVAAVTVLALAFAQTFARGQSWTLFRLVRLVGVIIGGALVMNMAMKEIGVEGATDLGGVQTYLEDEAQTAATTGTTVGASAPGVKGAPLGLINVLFRPVLFEVRNFPQLMSALELTIFWWLVFQNRRRLVASIRQWRADSALAFALWFTLLYATTLGMVMANMGIIVRQRIYIFPCLFLLLLAEPLTRRMVPPIRRRFGPPSVRQGT
jgi:hypothetical protein